MEARTGGGGAFCRRCREDIKSLIGDVRQDWRRMARTLAKDTTGVHYLRLVVPDLTTEWDPRTVA